MANPVDLAKLKLRIKDLKGANLTEAGLTEADLYGANLYGANLYGAKLRRANLTEANLYGADLYGANLYGAKLRRANLYGAKLTEADLYGADLYGAYLNGANLEGAYLNQLQALKTNFESANLTGACIEDWNINSDTNFTDIICDYIYLKREQQERRPSDPTKKFAPGEFFQLIQKSLETVDLIFVDGIDWKAFLESFNELKTKYGEDNIAVQAIEKKSGGAFIIKLEVPPEVDKAEIESLAKELYEYKLNLLEATYHKELKAKDEQITIYQRHNTSLENIINTLANRPIQTIIDVTANSRSESMSESYQSKYDLRNSNTQFVDTAQSGANVTFNQNNFSENINQNIDDITKIINSLREKAQDFPQDERGQVLVHLDDLQEDISKPEKQKPDRIKTRIIALFTIAGTLFGGVANSADFCNNALELAEKVGIQIPIEISQPQRATHKLPPS